MQLARSRAAVRPLLLLAGALALAIGTDGCASSGRHAPLSGGVERGVASWYGPGFDGRMTASGERYDMHAATAAHRTLPFGTILEVLNLDNGKSTRVTVNDRGPFKKNRIIDLSFTAASAIGMVGPGTARVELRTLVLGSTLRRYAVQVGAFQERGLADGLVARLSGQVPDLAGEIAVESEVPWHRVRVGLFDNPEVAAALRRKLVRLGYAAMVIEISTTPPVL
ncbi:MAG: septal ring lytic transglycosylase RlpA family protein [Thermoanaerobaculia bacterium]